LLYGRVNIVKLLIQRGADLNNRDNGGHSVLSLAQTSKAGSAMKQVVVKLLREAGAKG
jgi:ankyrin repeat protein